jgi:hypothetical protein
VLQYVAEMMLTLRVRGVDTRLVVSTARTETA